VKGVVWTTVGITTAAAALLGLLWLSDAPFAERVTGALDGNASLAFAYPWLLLALIPLVFFTLLALTRVRRKQIGSMAFTRGELLAGSPVSPRVLLRPLPNVLRTLAVFALILAVARPQVASEERLQAEGINIYLVLDMSGSMQAIDLTAEELRELQVRGLAPANRFEVAREVISEFVRRRRELPWSDRVGMVLFARQAFLQFPLTIDYATVLWLLDRLALEDIDASETAIGNAIGQAVAGLLDTDGESNIIILITDGSERGGNISAIQAANVAADQGIQVYPILVGREGPVLVRTSRASGFGTRYAQQQAYPVDVELLESVAEITEGQFFRAANRAELEGTLEDIIAEYEKTDFDELVHVERDDAYPPLLWAGFLLLGIELFLRYAYIRTFP